MKKRYGDKIWTKHGFTDLIRLDVGITLLSTENLLASRYAKAGIAAALPGGLQNSSFNPTCNCRGEFTCVLIIPNWLELRVMFGLPNCTVLLELKASTRNCAVNRSL